MKTFISIILTALISIHLAARPQFELATTLLGFHPESPKTVTFRVKNQGKTKLPDQISFYITKVGGRIPRTAPATQDKVWAPFTFSFPIEVDKGNYIKSGEGALYTGILQKKETSRGTFWQAEKMIQWITGHNTANLCLATGVGFKHPVPANFMANKISNAMMVGFLGYANDSPYQEESNVVEWSTQDGTVGRAVCLHRGRDCVAEIKFEK